MLDSYNYGDVSQYKCMNCFLNQNWLWLTGFIRGKVSDPKSTAHGFSENWSSLIVGFQMFYTKLNWWATPQTLCKELLRVGGFPGIVACSILKPLSTSWETLGNHYQYLYHLGNTSIFALGKSRQIILHIYVSSPKRVPRKKIHWRAAKCPCRQRRQIHRFPLWAQRSNGSQRHLAEDEGQEDHDMKKVCGS